MTHPSTVGGVSGTGNDYWHSSQLATTGAIRALPGAIDSAFLYISNKVYVDLPADEDTFVNGIDPSWIRKM